MTKNSPLNIRLEPAEKDALARAAQDDGRPLSALGRKIIAEWLKKNGWLGEAKK